MSWEALAILDVIDGIVDDTHPEGDGCPLCLALDDLRLRLDAERASRRSEGEAAPATDDIRAVVEGSSPWRNCKYSSASRASCPEVDPLVPRNWCSFCQAHTRLRAALATPVPADDRERLTLGDFEAAIKALPYPDDEPAGPQTWTDGWKAAIEAVGDMVRSSL